MGYSMIGRADRGGLGNQLSEVALWVPPERVVLMDVDTMRRGDLDLGRYEHVGKVRVQDGNEISADNLAWLCEGVEVCWSTECWYRRDGDALRVIHKRGVTSAMSVNPELWTGEVADVLTVPTTWEQDRVPRSTLLPHPVNRDLLPPRRHDGSFSTLYHPTAPAMSDRNGTDLVVGALTRARHAFRVIARHPKHRGEQKVGRSTIDWRPPADNYWEQYPDECDGLLLPRRYGGQSLSMNEAASLGWPIVTLDLEPQRRWFPPDALVDPGRPRFIPMKGQGGPFQVFRGQATALARRLDALAGDPARVLALHAASLARAETISWDTLLPRYREVLRA